MCGRDRVDIPSEVEIDIPHGVDLCVSSSGRTSLDTERGSERGFPKRSDDLLTEISESLHETDGCDGLSLTGRSGCDGGDHDELSVLVALELLEVLDRDLRDVLSVRADIVFRQSDFCCNLLDGAGFGLIGDVDIC